ncbi:MAG: hypothetical protein AAB225_30720 [Acidobacteriota bacterium]
MVRCVLAVWLCSPVLFGAAPLSGDWAMKVVDPNGAERQVTLKLTQKEGEVTGAVALGEIKLPLAEAKVAEDQLSFAITFQETTYRFTASVKGEAMEGKWEGGGVGGAWKASKKSAAAAAGDLSGAWECKATRGDMPDAKFTLELKQNGSEITGTASSDRGSTGIGKATLTGNKVEISIPIPEGTYVLTATLDGNKLSGAWQLSETLQGTWEGQRK